MTDEFMAQVEKTDTCWNWTGARYKSGYGLVHVTGHVNTLAHRLVYESENGPAGRKMVDQACGNKLCVNPGHLRLVGYPRGTSTTPESQTKVLNLVKKMTLSLQESPDRQSVVKAARRLVSSPDADLTALVAQGRLFYSTQRHVSFVELTSLECDCGRPKGATDELCQWCEAMDDKDMGGFLMSAMHAMGGGPATAYDIVEEAGITLRQVLRWLRHAEASGHIMAVDDQRELVMYSGFEMKSYRVVYGPRSRVYKRYEGPHQGAVVR